MRSDWCVVRSGALFIKDAENVSFENGTIRNIGGNGVFLSGHSKNVKINNNEIINIGYSGVLAAGFPNSCREPSFWENPPTTEAEPYYFHKTTIDDATPGPVKEHYPREAVISNNHIQNVGVWEKQSSQVAVSVSYKMQIVHNTIHERPRAGVNIGDGTFGGYDTGGNRGAQKEPYSRIDVIEKNIVVKGAPYVLAATDGNRFKVSEDKLP